MAHVFISYVRENLGVVRRLCEELTSHGVEVWLDRKNIMPGVRWKQAIRKAISEGAFFLTCFSKEYNERDKTYMNEELTLAIEELRRRPTDKAWFVPVKLSECEIPDRDIGAGETLQDIQWVELYKDWSSGIQRILESIGGSVHVDRERVVEILEVARRIKDTVNDILIENQKTLIPLLQDPPRERYYVIGKMIQLLEQQHHRGDFAEWQSFFEQSLEKLADSGIKAEVEKILEILAELHKVFYYRTELPTSETVDDRRLKDYILRSIGSKSIDELRDVISKYLEDLRESVERIGGAVGRLRALI